MLPLYPWQAIASKVVLLLVMGSPGHSSSGILNARSAEHCRCCFIRQAVITYESTERPKKRQLLYWSWVIRGLLLQGSQWEFLSLPPH